VSRSEDKSDHPEDTGPYEYKAYKLTGGRARRRDDLDFNELDVRIRVSYKTLLLVFVLLDVFGKVTNALIDSNTIQNLF